VERRGTTMGPESLPAHHKTSALVSNHNSYHVIPFFVMTAACMKHPLILFFARSEPFSRGSQRQKFLSPFMQ
jgi:hypothetical protein